MKHYLISEDSLTELLACTTLLTIPAPPIPPVTRYDLLLPTYSQDRPDDLYFLDPEIDYLIDFISKTGAGIKYSVGPMLSSVFLTLFYLEFKNQGDLMLFKLGL